MGSHDPHMIKTWDIYARATLAEHKETSNLYEINFALEVFLGDESISSSTLPDVINPVHHTHILNVQSFVSS